MNKYIFISTLSITLFYVLSSLCMHPAAEQPPITDEAYLQLYKAVRNGDIQAAQQALEKNTDINIFTEFRVQRRYRYDLPLQTPLEVATMNGDLNMVQFLLAHKAPVDTAIMHDTPLNALCKNKQLSPIMVKAITIELLTNKANLNTLNVFNRSTPLMNAISQSENEDLVKTLIIAGADTTVINEEGLTASSMIKTPSIREAFSEACFIRKQAFQELHTLEQLLYTKVLQNYHISIENLVYLIFDYALPYYVSHEADQSAYVILNEHIAQEWTQIKKAHENKECATSLKTTNKKTKKTNINNKASQKHAKCCLMH